MDLSSRTERTQWRLPVLICLFMLGVFTACTPIHPVDQPNANAPTPVATQAPAVVNVQQMLANQLHIEPADVKVIAAEAVEWPDACLGAPLADEVCAQVITPGHKFTLEAQGNRYTYHTDPQGYQIRLVEAPKPEIGETVVTWSSPNYDGGCRTATIGTTGVAFGRCGGVLLGTQFRAGSVRLADLKTLAETYASFKAETPIAQVEFQGKGQTVATPAEQRMIAEWAETVQLEAGAGRVSASWGNVFAWRREDKAAGVCEEVTAYTFGDAYVNSCVGEQNVNLARLRLSAEQLAQIFDWVDHLETFDVTLPKTAITDTATTHLLFAGLGTTKATEAEQQAMQKMALGLRAQVKTTTNSTPDVCPTATAETKLLVNEAHGYCLLYPTIYSVEHPNEIETALVISSLLNVVQPRLFVTVKATDQATTEQAADALAAEFQGFTIERSKITLGGEPAVLLDKLPGQDINRRIIVVHDHRQYDLMFIPADKQLGVVYEQMEVLYELVLKSFRFSM